MGLELDMTRLIKKLRRAKESACLPEKCVQQFSEDINPGLQYLIDHVLWTMMHGETVHTADLDLESFDEEDIADLSHLYYEQFFDGTQEWRQLQKVFQQCEQAAPLIAESSFI